MTDATRTSVHPTGHGLDVTSPARPISVVLFDAAEEGPMTRVGTVGMGRPPEYSVVLQASPIGALVTDGKPHRLHAVVAWTDEKNIPQVEVLEVSAVHLPAGAVELESVAIEFGTASVAPFGPDPDDENNPICALFPRLRCCRK